MIATDDRAPRETRETLAHIRWRGAMESVLDADGRPPHDDDCTVCCLFGVQRTGESRQDWLGRITQAAGFRPCSARPRRRRVVVPVVSVDVWLAEMREAVGRGDGD